jgi:hypothetical protein
MRQVTFDPTGVEGAARWSTDRFIWLEDGSLLTSTDGFVWRQTPLPNTVFPVTAVWTGQSYVVGGPPGTAYTSPDGIAWTSHATGSSETPFFLTWAGGRAIGFGLSSILSSPDGTTWTVSTPPSQGRIHDLLWTGQQYVVSTDEGLFTSTDGSTWQSATTPVEAVYQLVPTGSEFLAVAFDPLRGVVVLRSTDGSTWTELGQMTGQLPGLGSTIERAGSVYVGCAGSSRELVFSADALSWHPSPNPVPFEGCSSIASSGSSLIVNHDGGLTAGR